MTKHAVQHLHSDVKRPKLTWTGWCDADDASVVLCCVVLWGEPKLLYFGFWNNFGSPQPTWLQLASNNDGNVTTQYPPILIKDVEQCEPGEQSFPRGLIQDIACHAADLTDPVVINGHVDDEFICRLNFTGAAFGKCWLLFGIIFAPKQMEHNCTELASLCLGRADFDDYSTTYYYISVH